MANTITVWVPEEDSEPYTVLAESDMESAYDEMLDDVYGTVKVAGYEYDTSQLLKEVDPIAYRVGMADHSAGYTELEMPWEVYVGDQDERDEWVAEHLNV